MTADARIVLDIDDVLAIRIECVKCGAVVAIKPGALSSSLPTDCPMCGNFWEAHGEHEFSRLQHVVAGFGLSLKSASVTTQLPYLVKLEIKDQR